MSSNNSHGLASCLGDQTNTRSKAHDHRGSYHRTVLSHRYTVAEKQTRGDIRSHPQEKLRPSELITIGVLFALKGVGERAFYRWLARDWRSFFPSLPERTRLFRRLSTHRQWTRAFLAEPTVLGIADSYGIELIHPKRAGRSERQIGTKGLSNSRWIVGAKLCCVLNQQGRIVDWDCDGANVYDTVFHPLLWQWVKEDERTHQQTVDMVVLADTGFHAKESKGVYGTGDPPNLKICPKGHWNERMLVETVLSMLTVVCHAKHMAHRVWDYLEARLGFLLVAYNLLVEGMGEVLNDQRQLALSIAEFSL
jgi:hypothetical protein